MVYNLPLKNSDKAPNSLLTWEREIMKTIFRLTNEDDSWKIRTNQELQIH